MLMLIIECVHIIVNIVSKLSYIDVIVYLIFPVMSLVWLDFFTDVDWY